MKERELYQNEIYHVYNRGTEKREIFTCFYDYQRFVNTLEHYLYFPNEQFNVLKNAIERGVLEKKALEKMRTENPLVEIVAVTLMPNHFHLILKQLEPEGISRFMQKVGCSYVSYFNLKYERTGTLFEGRFKTVQVEDDAQLMCVSRYLHLNQEELLGSGCSMEDLISYPWSSLGFYFDQATNPFEFCNKELVLSLFKSKEAYKEFLQAELSSYQEYLMEELVLE